KEIHEQPHAIRRALLGRVVEHDGMPTLRLAELDRLVATRALDKVRRIALIACGTSYNASLLGKYAIERWARIPVEASIASEYRYADPIVGPDTLCIAITQSGETTDTVAATRLARERGAPIIAVSNIVGSAITRIADAVLYLQAGPEISVTATKTFVTTTPVLSMPSLWLGQRAGAIAPEELRAMLDALQVLPGQMQRVLDGTTTADARLTAIADQLAERSSCMFIGRGFGFPLALEGAL